MESTPNVLVAPNLNADVYRNYKDETGIPYYDVIDVNRDGHVFLGVSYLNSRIWKGTLYYFQDLKNLQNAVGLPCADDYDGTTEIMHGVTDGKFTRDGASLLTGDDYGVLSVWKKSDDEKDLKELFITYSVEQETAISEISVWPQDDQFVIVTANGSIFVYSIEADGLNSVHSFEDRHFHVATSVSANPRSTDIFASGYLDKRALLWDVRLEKPASVVYEHEFFGITRTCWHPSLSDILVISTTSGDVYTIDVRQPNEFVSKFTCSDRSIHRMVFNSSKYLAVCSDSSHFQVLECTETDLSTIYKSESHQYFVRDFAWLDESTVVSCGWDGKVIEHYV